MLFRLFFQHFQHIINRRPRNLETYLSKVIIFLLQVFIYLFIILIFISSFILNIVLDEPTSNDNNFNQADLELNDNQTVVTESRDTEVQTTNTYTNEFLLKHKIKILRQKLRRKEKKITNLDNLLKNLKNEGFIDSEQQNLMLGNFNGNF